MKHPTAIMNGEVEGETPRTNQEDAEPPRTECKANKPKPNKKQKHKRKPKKKTQTEATGETCECVLPEALGVG